MEHTTTSTTHHTVGHAGGMTGDPKFMGYCILAASVILALAVVFSAIATNNLAAKLSGLPAVGAVLPTVAPTAGLAPTVVPTTTGQLQPGAAAGPSLAGTSFMGNGTIVLIEFSDFQCPFCARAHPTVKRIIEQDYAGKVKWGYKHFPLDSLHPDARKAGEAFECMRDQGDVKAFLYADAVFDDQSDLSAVGLSNLVKPIPGANVAAFETCLKGGSKAAKVEADFQEGSALGVQGTPAFFLAKLDANGNAVGGWQSVSGAQPFSRFKTVIDAMLAQ